MRALCCTVAPNTIMVRVLSRGVVLCRDTVLYLARSALVCSWVGKPGRLPSSILPILRAHLWGRLTWRRTT